MSEGAHNKLLPKRVDPRKLAQMCAVYEGRVSCEQLPRLAKAAESLDHLYARIEFTVDEQRQRTVLGKVEAHVNLICQRCTEPMAVTVQSDIALGIVASEEKAENLSSRYDPWIVPDVEADLHEMLEDELLLALPIVVYHDHACIESALLSSGPAPGADQQDNDNPFKVLAALKTDPDSQ